MARPSDTEQNGGLKYALERTEKEANGAMAMARDTARMLGEHMIRCEAGTASLSRDISDMKKDFCAAIRALTEALARDHAALSEKIADGVADGIASHAIIAADLAAQGALVFRVIKYGGIAAAAAFMVGLVGPDNFLAVVKAVRAVIP